MSIRELAVKVILVGNSIIVVTNMITITTIMVIIFELIPIKQVINFEGSATNVINPIIVITVAVKIVQ